MASRSWNRVELIGNLTRDPELRYTPNGAAVCTFGIATNRTYVTEGEKKEEVDFHRLVSWNKLAELCNQLLKKGNRVFVSGRLQTRSWEGQDGQTRQVTEVVIEDMILLTPKANGGAYVGEEIAAEEIAIPAASAVLAPTSSKSQQDDEGAAAAEKPASAEVIDSKVAQIFDSEITQIRGTRGASADKEETEESEKKPAKASTPKEEVVDEDLPF